MIAHPFAAAWAGVARLGMAAAWAALLAWPAQAQTPGAAVYRCPGPPVLYTDAISAQEARDRNCRSIEGAPITVVQAPTRAAARPAATAAAPAAPRASEGSTVAKVDPKEQRARDTDAKRILEAELQRESSELAALRKDFNDGEPERRGDERNYAKYHERVADMKAAIARKEADIAALKRELAKHP